MLAIWIGILAAEVCRAGQTAALDLNVSNSTRYTVRVLFRWQIAGPRVLFLNGLGAQVSTGSGAPVSLGN